MCARNTEERIVFTFRKMEVKIYGPTHGLPQIKNKKKTLKIKLNLKRKKKLNGQPNLNINYAVDLSLSVDE